MIRTWIGRNPRLARYGVVLLCCMVGGLAARIWMALAGIDPNSTFGLAAPPVGIGLGLLAAVAVSRLLGLTPY